MCISQVCSPNVAWKKNHWENNSHISYKLETICPPLQRWLAAENAVGAWESAQINLYGIWQIKEINIYTYRYTYVYIRDV